MDYSNYPSPNREFTVLVRCNTYNQSKYIEDTLNGFAIQKTNFPFVCIVIDDASTDGEQNVIQSWLQRECDFAKAETIDIPTSNVIILPHRNNLQCTFAFYFLKQNLFGNSKLKNEHLHPWRRRCQYEAICEGDDYWIDSMKLQKQVDYLQSHPDCSMCFTGAKVIFEKGFKEHDVKIYANLYSNLQQRDYDGAELLKEWLVPTASILQRMDVQIRYSPLFMYLDIVNILSCAEYGRIHCLSDKMVVYRRNYDGLSARSQPLCKIVAHYNAIIDVFGVKYRSICKNKILINIVSFILTGSIKERADTLKFILARPSIYIGVLLSFISVITKVLFTKLKNTLGLFFL